MIYANTSFLFALYQQSNAYSLVPKLHLGTREACLSNVLENFADFASQQALEFAHIFFCEISNIWIHGFYAEARKTLGPVVF